MEQFNQAGPAETTVSEAAAKQSPAQARACRAAFVAGVAYGSSRGSSSSSASIEAAVRYPGVTVNMYRVLSCGGSEYRLVGDCVEARLVGSSMSWQNLERPKVCLTSANPAYVRMILDLRERPFTAECVVSDNVREMREAFVAGCEFWGRQHVDPVLFNVVINYPVGFVGGSSPNKYSFDLATAESEARQRYPLPQVPRVAQVNGWEYRVNGNTIEFRSIGGSVWTSLICEWSARDLVFSPSVRRLLPVLLDLAENPTEDAL